MTADPEPYRLGPPVLNPEPAALDRLPAGYRELFGRLLAAVRPDERVRAMWLSGSLARGVADAGSDLDVILAVRDADVAGFAEHWREWLAEITPTVLARPLTFAPGSFYSLTPDCLRLDVVVEAVSSLPDSGFRDRVVVLDWDGLDAVVPVADARPGPDRERMREYVEEQFRRLAIFPAAVVARQDWLLGVVGVTGAQELLYNLFVESNQPLPPMGVKQWSAKLDAAQRELLESLPLPQPNPDSVIGAMRAVVDAFTTAGRETLEAHDVAWPSELAESALAYFHREVG